MTVLVIGRVNLTQTSQYCVRNGRSEDQLAQKLAAVVKGVELSSPVVEFVEVR